MVLLKESSQRITTRCIDERMSVNPGASQIRAEESSFEEKILRCYESAVYPTEPYSQTLEDITLNVFPDDSILDIGCGTGILISKLDAKGVMDLTGIDKSEYALKIAKQRNRSTIKFVFGDFTETDFSERYSAIIANNLLNVVPDHLEVLEKAYILLLDGGRLIVSVPKKGFSLEKMMGCIRADLELKGIFDNVREDYDSVERFNSLLKERMKSFSSDEFVQDLVNFVGMEAVDVKMTYVGENYLFIAKKGGNEISFQIDKENKRINDIRALRKYCWGKLFGAKEYRHPDFDTSFYHFIAKNNATNAVLGVLSYTENSMIETLPIEHHMPIDGFVKDRAKIGALYGWCVLPTQQDKGIGASLLAQTLSFAKERGIAQFFIAINPQLKDYFLRIGFDQIGPEQKYQFLDANYVPLMLDFKKLKMDNV